MFNIFFLYTFLNCLLAIFFSRYKNKFNIYDYPKEKNKIHKLVSFPIGGIFIYINLSIIFIFDFIFSFELFYEYELINQNKILFFLTATIFFLIGLFDDKFYLKPLLRLTLLFLNISILIYFLDDFRINQIYFENLDILIINKNFTIFFTLISIILLIQIFNFFDGIDFQLSLYIIFICVYLFLFSKSLTILIVILPLCFMIYLNKFQRIFLGDSGVYLLSFIISVFIILNYNHYKINAEQVFLILLIPFLDFLRLFFERVRSKKNPMLGDLEHIHHIIIRKLKLYKTILIINLLYTFPLIVYYFFIDFFILIAIGTIISYASLIIHFRKS